MNKQKTGLLKWNLKIHIYIGLYLLFFIWLFGFSGLLLNHHWEFANFWEERKETSFEKTIVISGDKEEYRLVHNIMHKIDLNGNISNAKFSDDSIFLNFIISIPGLRHDIQANLIDGHILIKEIKFNKWGIMRALHVLRNPTLKEQGDRYQSVLASIWSFSMDIVSVSLILLCFGGWYLWIKAPRKRFYLGLISVASGFILCVFFLGFLS